ncbi:MAG: hypothetical protein ABSH08_14540 [Tepidisphaeraceae bacterium]|jgi:hypothetical protein
MPVIQDPDRAYVEKIHELLSVALRAIGRDDRQNGALRELWMMGVTRSKEVVKRDGGKIYKGLYAGNYLNVKPEHFITWIDQCPGWPEDLKDFTVKAYIAASSIVMHCKHDSPSNRGMFLAAVESLKQARDGIADILGIHNGKPDRPVKDERMNPQIVLPDWCRRNHANERSKRLRPFAPAGHLPLTPAGEPVHVPTSYPYPEDYGSKPNSVGWIGDASLAGKTDTQYGMVIDPQPLYLLADRDIEILLRWMPGGWNETKLQGLLLTEFNRSAAELPSLTWPNIIAMLAGRNPKPAAEAPAPHVAKEDPLSPTLRPSQINVYYGDIYQAVHAGAMGPNARAHDMSFQQIWNQNQQSIDLNVLAEQLAELRSEAERRAKAADGDIVVGEVGEITAAENAAQKGDGPAALKHLAACGRWAFGVATDIGVEVAATAIAKATGLSA